MIHVEVKNPRRVQSNPGQYFTEYQLVVYRDGVPTTSEAVEVYRRFRDFEWLHRQLHNDVPGAIIPVLPDKSAVTAVNQKFRSSGFLDQRGRDLTNLVNAIILNDEVSKSETATRHVEIFLSGSSEELMMTKRPSKNIDAAPASKGPTKRSSMSSFFNKLTAGTAAKSMVGPTFMKETVLTPEDMEIQTIEKEVDQRLAQLTKLETNSTTLITRNTAYGTQLSNLSQTCLALGEDNGNIALKAVGAHCSAIAAPRIADHSERQETALLIPLRKQINLLRAVKAAIAVREDVKRESEAAQFSLSLRTTEFDKANANPKYTDEIKTEFLQRLEFEQSNSEEKRRRVEVVTARFFRERQRTAQQRSDDIKNMMLLWVKIHMAHCQKSRTDWHTFMEDELGAPKIPSGRQQTTSTDSFRGEAQSFRGEGLSFRGEGLSFRGEGTSFKESVCEWGTAPSTQPVAEPPAAGAPNEPISEPRYSFAQNFNDEVSV